MGGIIIRQRFSHSSAPQFSETVLFLLRQVCQRLDLACVWVLNKASVCNFVCHKVSSLLHNMSVDFCPMLDNWGEMNYNIAVFWTICVQISLLPSEVPASDGFLFVNVLCCILPPLWEVFLLFSSCSPCRQLPCLCQRNCNCCHKCHRCFSSYLPPFCCILSL